MMDQILQVAMMLTALTAMFLAIYAVHAARRSKLDDLQHTYLFGWLGSVESVRRAYAALIGQHGSPEAKRAAQLKWKDSLDDLNAQIEDFAQVFLGSRAGAVLAAWRSILEAADSYAHNDNVEIDEVLRERIVETYAERVGVFKLALRAAMERS